MSDLVRYSRRLEDALGIPPLVRVNGKAPLDPSWTTGPRRDPGTWRAKLEGHRGNVGMLTGYGVVGFDVDLHHQGAADSLDALRDRGLTIYTVTNLTGGPGLHYLYRTPVDLEIPSRPLPDFPGIDVKAHGGMLVIPPSVHPSGVEYEWECNYSPFDCELVALSAPLLELVGAGTRDRAERELDERDHQAVELLLQHFDGHSPKVRARSIEVTRPGKERGASAEVGYLNAGVTTVWSSNWPNLPAGIYDLRKLRALAGVPGPRFDIPNVGARTYIKSALVQTRRQRWLFEDFLPVGQLVLGAGREKLGKSTAFVWMAARASRGELPGDLEGEPSNVVFISAEDDVDRTLKPRAIAAGADHHRLYFLNPVALGPAIELGELTEIDPRLVVIDPLSVYLQLASANEHGEMALRQALAPFNRLAQEHDATVVGVRHVRKGPSGDNAFDAVLGSRAWSAAPRALLFFTPDPKEPERHGGFVFPRGNLARGGEGRRYRLDAVTVALDDGSTAEVPLFALEEGGAGFSLEDALGPREHVNAREDAKDFLRETLADGAVPEKDVQARAAAEEFSPRTLRRAKKELGVVSERRGFGPGSVVYWRLPDIAGQETPQDANE
jgi:hypothetical protein